jgi:RNA polymerase sigma-70 factor (ECF subfamily)
MTQTMPDDATDFLPTRRSLLSRLKSCDDQTGWQEFFETYWRLIYGVAIKAGLNDAEAQDAVQETVIAVSKYIGEFTYNPEKCSFKTWLLRLTRQRVWRQLQKRQARPSLHTAPEAVIDDVERAHGQVNPSQSFTRLSTCFSWTGVRTARRRMSLTAGTV